MDYFELLEQGRYGSIELKHTVGRNLFRGLAVSAVLHAIVFLLPLFFAAVKIAQPEKVQQRMVVIDPKQINTIQREIEQSSEKLETPQPERERIARPGGRVIPQRRRVVAVDYEPIGAGAYSLPDMGTLVPSFEPSGPLGRGREGRGAGGVYMRPGDDGDGLPRAGLGNAAGPGEGVGIGDLGTGSGTGAPGGRGGRGDGPGGGGSLVKRGDGGGDGPGGTGFGDLTAPIGAIGGGDLKVKVIPLAASPAPMKSADRNPIIEWITAHQKPIPKTLQAPENLDLRPGDVTTWQEFTGSDNTNYTLYLLGRVGQPPQLNIFLTWNRVGVLLQDQGASGVSEVYKRGTVSGNKLNPSVSLERLASGDPRAQEMMRVFLSWWSYTQSRKGDS